MCTLIALHRCIPGAPLVVAANRDEFADRPARGPALRETEHGIVVAPLDAQAGGTWLGMNPAGIFAAITNRRADAPDPARRSRGWLVLDALGAGSAAEAAAAALETPPGAYNPFNLFVADRERAFAITYAAAPRCIELAPGAHVIGNADLGAQPPPKVARIAQRAARLASAPGDALLERLAELCRDHDGGGAPTDDTCVHAGAYGTRSSTLLRLAEPASESELLYADGAPCRTEYLDFTPLLHELHSGSGSREGELLSRRPI
ncbi:MAG TPA: NRDE family protein [Myxococcota bacterium]|jgi:uncharacterized protein with NRDE domain